MTRTSEVTIYDVAREAGVSIATVSRVLNGAEGVRARTAERVRAAVRTLGYRPNPHARSLQGQETGAVGLLVPQLEDPFFGKIVTGVERELRARGLHLLCALGHDDAGEEGQAVELFRQRQVDGVLLFSDHLSEERLLDLRAQDFPLVLINRFVPELASQCVRLDNARGGYLATRHLLDLGHTRVACITAPLDRQGGRDRLEGYRDALREAGQRYDDHLVVESRAFGDDGEAATARLLRRTGFTALFAASDALALGAMHALLEAGLRVPEDVSVIGFTDDVLSRYSRPALTTMHYPIQELGVLAARQLVALLAGETPGELPPLEPRLVVRGSTARKENL